MSDSSRVFISHNHRDDAFVDELASFLKGLNFQVFNDKFSIRAGERISPVCENEIHACDLFIVVHSEHSKDSEWVAKELKLALELGKRIIPIRLDETPKRDDLGDLLFYNVTRSLGGYLPQLRQLLPIRLISSSSSTLLRHSPKDLFGREEWLDELDAVWSSRGSVNVYALIAWGGSGKTSVVAHWVAKRLAARGWPGVERYFDWSFYSQGAREHSQASAGPFINAALKFFGDPDPQKGEPWERGQRLAHLVRQHRTLLVLDGIEPLQYPPNSPQAGELKDEALTALLQSLAMDNLGLCVVTSRESLKSLETFHGSTVEEKKLNQLTKVAAISLFRHLRLVGTEQEMEEAWRDAGGHALTLSLLGRFLADAHGGDIRRRREVRFEDADRETPGRTAMKVLLAYEKWLQSAGPERQRDLAVLRLTGLFDRPASPGCLAALRAEPAIPGLTEEIFGLKDWQWNMALTDLETLDLVTLVVGGDAGSLKTGNPDSGITIDAHPLVREYFAIQLRDHHPEAFRAGHSRLFDHLGSTSEFRPDDLSGLQPLYQAVSHGCLAGQATKALRLYRERILRRDQKSPFGYFSTATLGAIGDDLAMISSFFDTGWTIPKQSNLFFTNQSWVLHQAGFLLKSAGRPKEALTPLAGALRIRRENSHFTPAASTANTMAEINSLLGRIGDAIKLGAAAIELADLGQDEFQRVTTRVNLAYFEFLAGNWESAQSLFENAELIQRQWRSENEFLVSINGYRYIEFILREINRSFWRKVIGLEPMVPPCAKQTLMTVFERAHTEVVTKRRGEIAIIAKAVASLTLSHTKLLGTHLGIDQSSAANAELADSANQALEQLLLSGQHSFIPGGWLNAAAIHVVIGSSGQARTFLYDAEALARRAGMPLHLADIHLHRARLFRDRAELAEARELIHRHHYGRRFGELADAEEAAVHWPEVPEAEG